jgi:hyperosmotically inducible protein
MKARVAAAAVILAAVLAVPARAQVADDRKDDEVFSDVSKVVLGYPQFTIFDDVSAAVTDGVVTLQGKVTMPFKRQDIERRVVKIPGVKRVENRIGVLPVSQFDDELRYSVARAIYGSSAFWQYASMVNPPIHIIVEHGRVTLTGVVASDVERMMARSLATSFNAFSVTSQLKTDQEMRALLDRKGVS